jgi:hypothetical protein
MRKRELLERLRRAEATNHALAEIRDGLVAALREVVAERDEARRDARIPRARTR